VSGSRCLCHISSKSVKNCDLESADTTHTQTDRQTHKSENITGISAVHYVHLAEIIMVKYITANVGKWMLGLHIYPERQSART